MVYCCTAAVVIVFHGSVPHNALDSIMVFFFRVRVVLIAACLSTSKIGWSLTHTFL